MSALAYSIARSTWGRYLMLGLALLAGVGVWGEIRERKGSRSERARQDIKTLKTIRRMHDAGSRVATDRRSVADRMRKGTF